jgi:thiamine pyrophosphate-dependent acetolactate synthase large subunit-like protein
MALARPDRHVIAPEGDGSLLMNLGTLATVGATAARNLTVLLFDNRHYESSGGQQLPRVEVDFVAVARAARLAIAERLPDAAALAPALTRARGAGPAFYLLPTVFDPDEPIHPIPNVRTRSA